MTDTNRNLLVSLIKVSKIDSALAGIASERKKLESEVAARKAQVQKLEDDERAKRKTVDEKRAKYQKEEKFLKDERQKLTDRRKELASYNNYKLQQAAEKEVDYGMRQLNLREENLIKYVDEVEAVDKLAQEVSAKLESLRAELKTAVMDADTAFKSFEERIREYSGQREELVREIEASALQNYDRVRNKYPMDPVVQIDEKGICSGCFMTLGPQVGVQISRGNTLVKCVGCGRIVYLKEFEQ